MRTDIQAQPVSEIIGWSEDRAQVRSGHEGAAGLARRQQSNKLARILVEFQFAYQLLWRKSACGPMRANLAPAERKAAAPA